MKAIYSSLYLAPIAYYKCLLQQEEYVIEHYNHYEKKTFQNRCEILSSNGKIALSVPVEKSKTAKTSFKDIKIAYHTPWQKQHLRALVSSYQNSPFFEYYIDDFMPLYEQEFVYLLDFNMALHHKILELIGEDLPCHKSSSFESYSADHDYRFNFHPKRFLDIELKSYIQVFSDKLGFYPNLSILDLLFNLGPETELYLK